MGRSPASLMWRPAGVMRQPFGNVVRPSLNLLGRRYLRSCFTLAPTRAMAARATIARAEMTCLRFIWILPGETPLYSTAVSISLRAGDKICGIDQITNSDRIGRKPPAERRADVLSWRGWPGSANCVARHDSRQHTGSAPWSRMCAGRRHPRHRHLPARTAVPSNTAAGFVAVVVQMGRRDPSGRRGWTAGDAPPGDDKGIVRRSGDAAGERSRHDRGTHGVSLRLGLALRGRLHGSKAGLHFARQVRHNPDHALDEHELRAVMHFVLFHSHQHFEACLAGGRHARRHGYGLAQNIVREGFQPRTETLTAGAQQIDDFTLAVLLLLLGEHALEKTRKVEAHQRRTPFAVDLMLYGRYHRDMYEHLRHCAGVGCGTAIVFRLGDLLGDGHGVLADGAECSRQVFGSIDQHKDSVRRRVHPGPAGQSRRVKYDAEVQHGTKAFPRRGGRADGGWTGAGTAAARTGGWRDGQYCLCSRAGDRAESGGQAASRQGARRHPAALR